MSRVRVSIDIAATPDIVWADVESLESHVEWMADAERIDFDGEQRSGVGTVMRVLTKVGPLRTVDVIRVTTWEVARSIGVRHEGLVTGTGEFRLEPISGGTRFLWTEELEMPWYLGGAVGAVAAKPILTAIWRRNLKRLALRFAGEPSAPV